MKRHRFYYPQGLGFSEIIITERQLTNQVQNVLKLQRGESLILFDGEGNEVVVSIKEIAQNKITFLVEERASFSPPRPLVRLCLAILKKENFEFVISKTTELGISEFVPLLTKRTIKFGLKEERLFALIKEASEQSGRNFLPKLKPALKFEDYLEKDELLTKELNLFCDCAELDSVPIFALLRDKPQDNQFINIFIGPEGGWTEEERALAKAKNFSFCSLGQNVLRAETAALVASWLAVNT